MSNYDFKSLSPHDFEELSRDLLQKEWGFRLESFKSGRDQGIDLRYTTNPKSNLVIQCKHFVGSGFGKLVTHLKNVELPKVKTLRPSRYVLVTSVGLTPPNKQTIINILQPFLQGPADIFGQKDLNNLLGRHPEVEQSNFKLWLSSSAVLERALHAAEVCQTEFEVRRIHAKIRLYVQNACYPRALEILERDKVVVISGIPGIGKTTLAEMLLYRYLEQEYAPFVIKSDTNEGRKFFKQKEKQIFYFDDFLGQTFLGERPGFLFRNEDASLLDFMQMVKSSPRAKLIMTTREHILGNAMIASERFARSGVLHHRCILELKDYSFGEKAKILYNHIYFSDLPKAYRAALVKDDFFLEALAHQNFNPRLVEWLSGYARIKDTKPSSYSNLVLEILDSPQRIWQHAFDRQISESSRSLLLALYTLGGEARLPTLKRAWDALHKHRARKYNLSTTPDAFRSALKELEGAFVKIDRIKLEFLNPSIKDFLAEVIACSEDHASDVLTAACYFDQLSRVWQLARTKRDLYKFLVSNEPEIASALSRVISGPRYENVRFKGSVLATYEIDINYETRLKIIAQMADSLKSDPIWEFIDIAANNLTNFWSRDTPDFLDAVAALEAIDNSSWERIRDATEPRARIKKEMLKALADGMAQDFGEVEKYATRYPDRWTGDDANEFAEAFRVYMKNGFSDERSNCDSTDELEDLVNELSSIAQNFEPPIQSKIASLFREIAEKRFEEPEEDSGRVVSWQNEAPSTPDDVAAVKNMFQTLLV